MIVKGSMIAESYAALAAWDFSISKKKNLDRLKSTNFIGAGSDSWLINVAKVLNRRFDPARRDRALVTLAKAGCNVEEWKPLLLWHMTRDEFLVRDFLMHWLFPACYMTSAFSVQNDELHAYLVNIGKRGGTTEHAWSRSTLHRVAVGLLRIAADFGLLNGSKVREFAAYQLPERSFIYLLHTMQSAYKSPKEVINALDWRMFLLCPSDVERELLRLHKAGKLEFEAAGGTPRLSLPCKTAEEYAETMPHVARANESTAPFSAS